MNKKIKDITGQKFGRLIAVEPTKKRVNNRVIWKFICDCGNSHECSSHNAINGHVNSCGCIANEHIKKIIGRNTLPNKQGIINKLYGRYKREALQRGYDFDLTMEEFKSFIFEKCYYCDSEPIGKFYQKTNTKDINIIYNGIDRLINENGYNKDNCVTCCKICNKMKMNLDESVFIDQITKIYQKRIIKNE